MMRITTLSVHNFRSLANLELSLPELAILIGRNNAGKSNILLAIKTLLEGTSRDLTADDFFDDGTVRSPYFEITAELSGVSQYLPLLAETHRQKIEKCVLDDKLSLRRLATLQPLDLGKLELWQPEKSQFGLPTGIETALKQFLPEVIFIEAFKDPSAEAQSRGTATLGKILKQIVDLVSEQVGEEVDAALTKAARKFNVLEHDGKLTDERPEEIRRIEGGMRTHLQAVFHGSDLRLRFKLPEVPDLMGSVTIDLKDTGPWTAPEGKGQGFQRILYLALLQTLAEELRAQATASVLRPFVLLFEEPESFLHPALQREIARVLEGIATTNQVFIATHSPLFVSPARLSNTLILRQTADPATGIQSTSCCVPDLEKLHDAGDRQLASLLKYATSGEFLFADVVLVVEGVSDRSLLGACLDVLRPSLPAGRPPVAIAIIDAGNKTAIPIWLSCLQAMGFVSRGLTDLDFLWSGAGRCMGPDPHLSAFCQSFWNLAEGERLLDPSADERNILKGKKSLAFDAINTHLRGQANDLRSCLRDDHRIWVLAEGDIERYFGLSQTSKGEYTAASQKILNRELPVHEEIKELMLWATGGGA